VRLPESPIPDHGPIGTLSSDDFPRHRCRSAGSASASASIAPSFRPCWPVGARRTNASAICGEIGGDGGTIRCEPPPCLRVESHPTRFGPSSEKTVRARQQRWPAAAVVPRLNNVTLASNAGFSANEFGDLLRLTLAHQAELLEAWHGYFGTDRNG